MLLLVIALACQGGSTADREAKIASAHAAHMQKMAALREQLKVDLGAAYDAPVPGLDAADAERGRLIYETDCKTCHGPAGKGDGPAAPSTPAPPADFTDPYHARYYSDAGRMQVIRKGHVVEGMPPYEAKLSEAQILDVYKYIAGLRP